MSLNRRVLFLLLTSVCFVSLLPLGSSALEAPYLISADAIDDHTVNLNWRNNDLTTEGTIILRRSINSGWVSVGTVIITNYINVKNTSYLDTSLLPSTQYYFALLSQNSSTISDTSNILSVKTLSKMYFFKVPKIKVTWIEGHQSINITYFDSCTMEKGFKVFKRELPGNWTLVSDEKSNNPDSIGWREIVDRTAKANSWNSYKVQAYNDSQQVFSPETTIYNYMSPPKNKSYSIFKLSKFPANPISWIEKVGDSLYFPEIVLTGDTQIAVINISNPSSPQFISYLKFDAIPALVIIWERSMIQHLLAITLK